jgi:hypothetical protein
MNPHIKLHSLTLLLEYTNAIIIPESYCRDNDRPSYSWHFRWVELAENILWKAVIQDFILR